MNLSNARNAASEVAGIASEGLSNVPGVEEAGEFIQENVLNNPNIVGTRSLSNSFRGALSNRFSRKWGTSAGESVDPYITGYFHTKWLQLPAPLLTMLESSAITFGDGNKSGLYKAQDVEKVLSASCVGVTIPGGTINKAEFTGLGGSKWYAPTNIDYEGRASMRFIEFSTTPILAIFHAWARVISDYKFGISLIQQSSTPTDELRFLDLEGDAYQKRNYTASMYYWTTQPDGKTVEYYSCLTGLIPGKDPQDLYSSDITSNDKVEVDMDFTLDYLYREKWTLNQCQYYSNQLFEAGTDYQTASTYRPS